ncbi:MAG: hypothetical protein U0414_02485 [Polyangiaceae bacterium]
MRPLMHRHVLLLANPLVVYFHGEKLQGWFWFAIGVAAIFGGWKLVQSRSPLRAMGFPLAIVGLVQAGVGAYLVLWTDSRVHDLMAKMIYGTPLDDELARVTKVARMFLVAEIVEGALFVVGAGLAMWKRGEPARVPKRRERDKDPVKERRLFAIGCGLMVQAAAMFALDFVAARRADTYLAELRTAHDTPPTPESMAKWLDKE